MVADGLMPGLAASITAPRCSEWAREEEYQPIGLSARLTPIRVGWSREEGIHGLEESVDHSCEYWHCALTVDAWTARSGL